MEILLAIILQCTAPSVASEAGAGQAGSAGQLDAQDWQLVGEDDGVRVFRKEVPGTELFAFRGETVMDASMSMIASILMDTSRKHEWVARLGEARNVEIVSDFERIEYNHTHSGFFLVKDRDFVFRAVGTLNRKQREFKVVLTSIEDSRVPETRHVRGQIQRGVYTIKDLGNSKSQVSVEIHLDPKGSVPRWLVNLIQKSWPKRTLDGIRRQAQKTDIVRIPAAVSIDQAR